MSVRLPLLAALALALGACGSHPPAESAAVIEPREALLTGMQSYDDQRYLVATQQFVKAGQLFQSLDDSRGEVMARVNLADCELILGEVKTALEQLAQAQRLVDRDALAEFQGRLALLHAQALRESGAAPEARAALDAVLNGTAEPAVRQAALLERARIELEIGADGERWLEQARATAPATPLLRASLERLESLAARRGGDRAGADEHLRRALELFRGDHYRPGIAAMHEELGASAAQAGARAAARDHYERALAIREWLGDRVHSDAAKAALSRLGSESGR